MRSELPDKLLTWMASGKFASVAGTGVWYRVMGRGPWLGPLHRTRLPLKLIWGRRDPIAVYAIAEKICTQNPRASLLTLDDVAHYPQLETPQQVANGVLKVTLNAEIT